MVSMNGQGGVVVDEERLEPDTKLSRASAPKTAGPRLRSSEDLLGQNKKAADDMSRVAGLDNQGIVGLQRQIMKEQDEGLEKLEETVLSTKHIALAVNEELTLHARLIDDLEDHVDVTNFRLQRVQKTLAVLNKRTKGGCSCMCLLLSVVAIVILAAIVWLLIKYL
ncbi:hypothetical protein GUJ93_ZPchr0008g11453 [Zizania palustris]|uniref:t-SNARE coiled-coil homology domain-containing protein n=1 Tax=Zizania palustris TaxID=103762 RepID=A0A8J5RC98_ZIZPA|nr:hypothetical protein GUJ93_ZPchr0008g11453 [Zizania palustris]